MIRLVIIGVLFGATVLFFDWFNAPRLCFKMGNLVQQKGRVSPKLRQAFEDIARHRTVSGVVRIHKRKRLSFSMSIQEVDRQAFRNIANLRF